MKNVLLATIAVCISASVMAQKPYVTEFKNDEGSKIMLMMGGTNITVIGHDKNTIEISSKKIENTGTGSSVFVLPDFPSMPEPFVHKEDKDDEKERSKGLKPLSSETNDNTGLGLSIENEGNVFKVSKILSSAFNKEFEFRIPNKCTLVINDMHSGTMTSYGKSVYKITGISGEINIKSLNSDLNLADITGPVVATMTNGSVEVNYSKVTPDKPNSFMSVNGFVDISLPSGTKADLKLNTVNGEAFTDFEIDAKNNKYSQLPGPDMKMFKLEGTINGGGVPISVQSVNGNIYLRRK